MADVSQPADGTGDAERLEEVLRWEESGGTWQVLAEAGDRVTLGLFTCSGGEEMDRIVASRAAIAATLGGRRGSEETMIRLKRIYEAASADDGYRILVDRLWPRGVSKPDAELDQWCKEVAPSPSLRTWWNHDPDEFDEFARRYVAELEENPAVDELHEVVTQHPVATLLYGARDPEVNHAVVLRDFLREVDSAT